MSKKSKEKFKNFNILENFEMNKIRNILRAKFTKFKNEIKGRIIMV